MGLCGGTSVELHGGIGEELYGDTGTRLYSGHNGICDMLLMLGWNGIG